MEVKIILLNALKYKDKKSGQDCVRIGYVPFDKSALRDNDNFKGFTELGGYSNRVDCMKEFKSSDFMQEATLIVEEVSSPVNPLKKTMRIKEIVTKNATISLL